MKKQNNTLALIRTRAKKLQAANKNLKWIPAIKKASTQLRAEKKIGVQTGKTNKKVDSKLKAKAPGKRVSASGNTYTERRANRSDVKGSLNGVSEAKLIGEIRTRVNGTMGKAYAAMCGAKTKKDKAAFLKIVNDCKRKLKKLQ